MSPVDYTIAVRRRPEWRRVRLQPGLWLAWAVMIAALLMAIAPQWFTSANPLEGIPGAQRTGAAGALLAGYRPAGARPVDAGGLRRGAFPVCGADRRCHRPRWWVPPLAPSPGRWPDAWNPPSCALGRCPAGHPLPAAAAHGDYSAGFRHGECGGGGWRRGYRQLRPPRREQKWCACATAITSRRPGAAAAPFSPSSGAIFCPTRSLRCLLSRRCSSDRRCWPRPPSASSATAPRRRSRSGDY